MTIGYRIALALTSLALLATSSAAPAAHHRARRQKPALTKSAGAIVLAPDDLYSPRALRRLRVLLQLRLLELRKARLERVERALRERLPADLILEKP